MKTNKILKSAVSCAHCLAVLGVVVVLAFFASCSNVQTNKKSEKTQKLYTVSGTVSSSGALPSSILEEMQLGSRSASVSMDTLKGEGTYEVCASYSGYEEMDNYNFDGEVIPDSNNNLNYQIALPKGSWFIQITKTIKNGSDTGTLSGYISVTVEDTNLTEENVVLHPSKSSFNDGKGEIEYGKVNLAFYDKTESQKLSSVQYKCLKNEIFTGVGGKESETLNALETGGEFSFEDGVAKLSLENISCDNYLVEFSFNDLAGNTLYCCKEYVQVFSGFTTDAWFGNSGHINNMKFEVTDALIENYGTEPVPNTKTVVYQYFYDDKTEEEGFKLLDKKEDGSETQIAKSDFSEFDFDKDGNIYWLTRGDSSHIAIKTNRAGVTNSTTTITCNSPDGTGQPEQYFRIAIDRVRDNLWIFKDEYDSGGTASRHFYIYENISGTTSFANQPTVKELASETEGYFVPEEFAVNDGIIYLVGDYEFDDVPSKALFYGDPAEHILEGGDGRFGFYTPDIELITEGVEMSSSDDNSDLNIPVDGLVASDIIYQDGALYVLFNDDGGDSFETRSRGVLVKVDLVLGEKYINYAGWNKGCSTPRFISAYGYFNSGAGTPGYVFIRENTGTVDEPEYTYTRALLDFNTGTYGQKFYAPYESNGFDCFVGPRKFIAIKPKKLVISDSGIAIYTDSVTGALCYRKVNRIVEVDLETLSLNPQNEMTGTNFMKESEYPEPSPLSDYYLEQYKDIHDKFILDFVVKNGNDYVPVAGSGYRPIIVSDLEMARFKSQN